MENALKLVQQLVKDFKEQESYYLSPQYQESQVRQDFIDKFFTALGWDVTHERQKNPYQQEVKIENKVNTQGSQRRADYAFFFAPNFRDVKFFVEAKKPAQDLKNADYYHQTIRYGWNQRTPIAVLTDFEEFHILDCRFKPEIKTALEHGIETFRYTDYVDKEKFAKIFYLFGREAVAGGSLEKYASELPKPRGKAQKKGLFRGKYQPVDEAFLDALDGYRVTLAKEFKKSNPSLDGEELTEAVQRTLDRLVFIRFLEDKSIEAPLINSFRESPSVWKAFISNSKNLDEKYNGVVFRHHKILDETSFHPPDDEAFVKICDELSDVSSPYDFDKIPISILGSIYERFLGKVVSATDKQVRVVEKPEVRKAHGVYYTPEYIVRYIVSNTVEKLIEGKTPEEISKMAFADIACGSGSFLIEVYSVLLDYHTRYYNLHPEKAKKEDIVLREGKTYLSLKKKQEILLNNIYGVDIDPQAVEVTQLSLYLKLLEDVTMGDAFQFSLLKEKILPDLRKKIVCGNSLVGTDIRDGKLFDDEEEKKLNPMDFETAFPEIMRRGGFDAVVGNPPYEITLGKEEKSEYNLLRRFNDYCKEKYKTIQGEVNLYKIFTERAIILVNKNGVMGYIMPTSLLNDYSNQNLRAFILDRFSGIEINEFPEKAKVFQNVTQGVSVYIFRNSVKDIVLRKGLLNESQLNSPSIIVTRELINKMNYKIPLFESEKEVALTTKLSRFKQFKDFEGQVKILEGEIHLTKFSEALRSKKTNRRIIRLIRGDIVQRYILTSQSNKSYFVDEAIVLSMSSSPKLKDVTVERLVYQQVVNIQKKVRLNFYYLNDKAYLGNTCGYLKVFKSENFPYNIKYFLGVLNSQLLNWRFKLTSSNNHILTNELYDLPFSTINFSDPANKSRHDHIVKLVEQMLAAKEKLAVAKLDSEINRLEMEITSLDRQIDEAVYELYGLTEEEVRVVEGKK